MFTNFINLSKNLYTHKRYIIMKRLNEKQIFTVVTPWKTFASSYKEEKLGTAAIKHSVIQKGTYLMEGINGYIYYKLNDPQRITSLYINDEE